MGHEKEKRFEDLCRQGDELFFQTLFKQKKEPCPLEQTTAQGTVDGVDVELPDQDEGAHPTEHQTPKKRKGKSGPA